MQKPLIAVLLASAFFSLNAQATDLIQVYQQALANDATYASARAALAAGEEKVTQGRSLLLPTIGINGAITKNDAELTPFNVGQVVTLPNGNTTIASAANSNLRTNQYTILLQQPLFRWANWQSYQQSKLQVAISEAQFAQAQQDLITRVAQAYFDVLAAQDTLESTRAQKTAVTEQLASASATSRSAPRPSPTPTRRRRPTTWWWRRNSPPSTTWTTSAPRCSRSSATRRPRWRRSSRA